MPPPPPPGPPRGPGTGGRSPPPPPARRPPPWRAGSSRCPRPGPPLARRQRYQRRGGDRPHAGPPCRVRRPGRAARRRPTSLEEGRLATDRARPIDPTARRARRPGRRRPVLLGPGRRRSGRGQGLGDARAALAPGKIDHVMVIELENEGFEATFGPSSPATYLNEVLRPKGELLARLLRHRPRELGQLHRPGVRPGPDDQHPGRLRLAGVRERDTGHPHHRGTGEGRGVRLPALGGHHRHTARRQVPAEPDDPRRLVARLRGGDGQHSGPRRRRGRPHGGDRLRPPGPRGEDGGGGDPHRPVRHPPRPLRLVPFDHRRPGPLRRQRGPARDPRRPTGNRRPRATWPGTSRRPRPPRASPSSPPTSATTATTHRAPAPTAQAPTQGGLVGADDFLRHWVPAILASPAYRSGSMLVVITFDEADVDPSAHPTYADGCCHEQPGPNTPAPGNPNDTDAQAPGGGRVGALLLNSRYLKAGSDRRHPLQPLLGPAQLRGPPGADHRGHRRPRPPGLRRGPGPRPLRPRRLQQGLRQQG